MRYEVDSKSRFRRIAVAGIFFQGGAATVDTSTIIAALVHGLSSSVVAVGAAAAIARYGWLFPQLIVAYLAERRQRRLPFYIIGAFGRVACLVGVAAVVATVSDPTIAVPAFFVLWTLYAFVSGIVAVPYNDIVARSVPSERRSRLLSVRFFGGGVLALAVAGVAERSLGTFEFPGNYLTILLLGAVLLLISALSFVSAGEPGAHREANPPESFGRFVRAGIEVFRRDRRFRLFLYATWLGGGAAMALPFYIIQATSTSNAASYVAILLGAQTAGALLSNPLWGWLGDTRGKHALLETVAAFGPIAPLLALAWIAVGDAAAALSWFAVVFVLLGALANGGIIAQLGYLMEISPDDRRPAYSGYFNALAAPAALLPIAGALIVEAMSSPAVFAASAVAAALQFVAIRRLRKVQMEDALR